MDFITFPALGWTFNVSPELFTIKLFGESFTVYWYGVMIALGFALAMVYGFVNAKRLKIDPDRMIDEVIVATVCAVIGARLYYILFSGDLSAYLKNPGKIFAIRDGGLAIYGGVIAAFVTGLWICKVRKVSRLKMFDLAAIGFLIGQGIGRWGNFFNQEAFGANTTLPWGMSGSIIASGTNGSGYNPGLPVHPTFLYESLWCLIGVLILHITSKKAFKFKGQLFCMYVMWYGLGRSIFEGLRTDSLMIGDTIRVSQLLAILSVVAGGCLFWWLYRRSVQAKTPIKVTAVAEPEDVKAEEITTLSLLDLDEVNATEEVNDDGENH